ncbi:MAG: fimbrillin family protein, partial [Rikenellaceae bacterium]
MKKIIIATFALVAMVGCTKEESVKIDTSSDVEATFAAEIITRTSGNDWESADQVGIYMYESGTSDNTYSLARENVLHTSDASGNFTVYTGVSPIYYPQTDKVDFYAYYPYQAGIATTYTADITAQNLSDGSFDQGAVDFVTASLTEKLKSEESLKFTFEHRLAMLTLVITPKESVPSLKDVEVSLGEINTQATFSVLTGALESSSGVMG